MIPGGPGSIPTIAGGTEPVVRLGTLRAAPVSIGPAPGGLVRESEQLAARLHDECAGLKPSEIPGLVQSRELYRSFGIDPTRVRPSSEALLRRVMKNKPLPRICNAVDLCNLCSLMFLLPIGLYDGDRIEGKITLRRGLPGESYRGIRKDDVHLHGRPVLVDDAGPFGNPTSDSLRTSITESTTVLLMVIFAPPATSSSTMEENVLYAADRMARYLGGPDRPVKVLTSVR